MMNKVLLGFFFMLSGAFMATGLIAQVEIILQRAQGVEKNSLRRVGAYALKFLGFAMAAYFIIYFKPESLVLNLLILLSSFITCFLFYLLAKHFLLR